MKNKKKSGGRAQCRHPFLPTFFSLCFFCLSGHVLAMEAEEGDSRSGLPPKFSTPTKPPVSSVSQVESQKDLMIRVNRWLEAQAQNFFGKKRLGASSPKS